jgi:hypothetical protein
LLSACFFPLGFALCQRIKRESASIERKTNRIEPKGRR